jgi:transcriptional regulator with XRE-family HTH domain
MSVHTKIREGRARLGLTEQQFADKIGVSRSAVQQWEQEDGTAPNRSRQKAVAELLGLTVSELMTEESISQEAYGIARMFDSIPADKRDSALAATLRVIVSYLDKTTPK